jgi:hypothetical protein
MHNKKYFEKVRKMGVLMDILFKEDEIIPFTQREIDFYKSNGIVGDAFQVLLRDWE